MPYFSKYSFTYFALSASDLIQSGGLLAEGLCARGQLFKQCEFKQCKTFNDSWWDMNTIGTTQSMELLMPAKGCSGT